MWENLHGSLPHIRSDKLIHQVFAPKINNNWMTKPLALYGKLTEGSWSDWADAEYWKEIHSKDGSSYRHMALCLKTTTTIIVVGYTSFKRVSELCRWRVSEWHSYRAHMKIKYDLQESIAIAATAALGRISNRLYGFHGLLREEKCKWLNEWCFTLLKNNGWCESDSDESPSVT